MLRMFPEIRSRIKSISFGSVRGAMGEWKSSGNITITNSGLSDYGTGIHEASHALDAVRSKKGINYSDTVLIRARKNLKSAVNSKEYGNLCVRMTGKAVFSNNNPELFAYAMETSLGGVRNKLADEVLNIVKGDS